MNINPKVATGVAVVLAIAVIVAIVVYTQTTGTLADARSSSLTRSTGGAPPPRRQVGTSLDGSPVYGGDKAA